MEIVERHTLNWETNVKLPLALGGTSGFASADGLCDNAPQPVSPEPVHDFGQLLDWQLSIPARHPPRLGSVQTQAVIDHKRWTSSQGKMFKDQIHEGMHIWECTKCRKVAIC